MSDSIRKTGNGRWRAEYIAKVIDFAQRNSDAEAMRKYRVPHSTYYAWKRRSEYQKKAA